MQRSLSRSSWGVFHSRLHIFVVGRGRQRARDQLVQPQVTVRPVGLAPRWRILRRGRRD